MDRLETDIEELNQVDPKYLPMDEIKRETSLIIDEIAALNHIVFLQPNDSWMLADNVLLQLPSPPAGEGLSMLVSVFPVVKALGGGFVWDQDHEKWHLVRMDQMPDSKESSSLLNDEMLTTHPELITLTMTLREILLPLKMGILLMENGSVYIGERKQLAQLHPPDLDDHYRLILHPFRDEDLFVNDFYTDEWGYKRRRYSRELAIRSLAFSKSVVQHAYHAIHHGRMAGLHADLRGENPGQSR